MTRRIVMRIIQKEVHERLLEQLERWRVLKATTPPVLVFNKSSSQSH